MPIYEYHCLPCDHHFEILIRNSSDVARCPVCGNIHLTKELSVPAAAQSGRMNLWSGCTDSSIPTSNCDRPQCKAGRCAYE